MCGVLELCLGIVGLAATPSRLVEGLDYYLLLHHPDSSEFASLETKSYGKVCEDAVHRKIMEDRKTHNEVHIPGRLSISSSEIRNPHNYSPKLINNTRIIVAMPSYKGHQ